MRIRNKKIRKNDKPDSDDDTNYFTTAIYATRHPATAATDVAVFYRQPAVADARPVRLRLCRDGRNAVQGLLLWLSVAMSLVLAYRFIYLKRMIYRITDEQLIYEHGVITGAAIMLELYPGVVDFAEQSNLLQQLCGLKTVSVHSGDRTTPRLDIIGMDMNNDLVSVIRGRVELNKRRKGIYEITNR